MFIDEGIHDKIKECTFKLNFHNTLLNDFCLKGACMPRHLRFVKQYI